MRQVYGSSGHPHTGLHGLLTDVPQEVTAADKARKVIVGDFEIDQQEIEVEEECLKLLALYQPVAGDLRFLVAVIKINSELERIGDLASNIGERAMALIDEHPIPVPPGFAVMSDRTGSILEKVLDALVRQDVHAAREVLAADDEIDMLYQGLIEDLKHIIRWVHRYEAA